ncbi:hypothetical protein ZIOFF_051119 [Zingiber officinale]|uniref:Uncharacterized protein n=1 Tax=Zingiber officinale TaxID=94328 RepID=A0A8J5FLI0_ZINOF|nr:hypothetical protein ZIOFF_051119 [Zingiber officinale]
MLYFSRHLPIPISPSPVVVYAGFCLGAVVVALLLRLRLRNQLNDPPPIAFPVPPSNPPRSPSQPGKGN